MTASYALDDALSHYFGFPRFRPGQREALDNLLNGIDTLVVMPTGQGKSLVYQLAALLLPNTTLVISPLVSLMKDQADRMLGRNIAATYINSSLSGAEQSRRLRSLAGGDYKIALVAPERLRNQEFRRVLAHLPLSLLVIDEAHCLSQWGHDFRPDYLHIVDIRQQFQVPVTLALTATATNQVQDEISNLLALPAMGRIITGFNRPNLSFEVLYTSDVADKLQILSNLLVEGDGAGIIYNGTRRDAEEVAEFVQQVLGLSVRYYHAGLDPETRNEIQDQFMAGDLNLIAATNAFGMGIDRPDLRFVLHYTMPGSLEAYYQEAGRAGRDELPARSILLYSPKDTALHEYFIDSVSPNADELRSVYECLSAQSASKTSYFRLDDLTSSAGLPEVKARVSLEQLEMSGALSHLSYEAGNMIHVQLGKLVPSELRRISAQAETRRQQKRTLLSKMVDYAQTNNCRRRSLLDYFGDTASAEAPICCDNCLSKAEVAQNDLPTAQTQSERAALIILDTIYRLEWKLGKGKVSKILKGSTSKDVSRFSQHRHYGKFADLRIGEIESMIDHLIQAGYIKAIGSRLPVLALTSKGEEALKRRAAIPLELRPLRPDARLRQKVEREAGGTVALTGKLLEDGLSPSQIAAERGLAESTIYSHLARLIAEGKVNVDDIVPQEMQRLIHSAIETVASVEWLAPIKAQLPEQIDYNMIRCVVEAWKLERGFKSRKSSSNLKSGQIDTSYIYDLGEAGSLESIPELIAALQNTNANVRRLAASALGKLRDEQGVKPLISLLEKETKPQVRQYAIVALGRIRDKRAIVILERIANDKNEIEYNRSAARSAIRSIEQSDSRLSGKSSAADSNKKSSPDLNNKSLTDSIASFLSKPHPRVLKGPWLAGWALDFHSRYVGADHVRGLIGDLVFRYKYQGEHQLADELACYWAELLGDHPELPPVQGIIPIPPSVPRAFDPVLHLARSLAARLGIPLRSDVLVKTRSTQPQKELKSLSAKQRNVASAFALRGKVSGQNLLLVDDLYDSGATLGEAARTLSRGMPASIVVLTLTKTIHADL
jgi:ATP-dependent DNA helicase RecQ